MDSSLTPPLEVLEEALTSGRMDGRHRLGALKTLLRLRKRADVERVLDRACELESNRDILPRLVRGYGYLTGELPARLPGYLRSAEPAVAAAAVKALVAHDGEQALALVMPALKAARTRAGAAMARALIAKCPAAAPELVRLAGSRVTRHRFLAVVALEAISGEEAIAHLERMLVAETRPKLQRVLRRMVGERTPRAEPVVGALERVTSVLASPAAVARPSDPVSRPSGAISRPSGPVQRPRPEPENASALFRKFSTYRPLLPGIAGLAVVAAFALRALLSPGAAAPTHASGATALGEIGTLVEVAGTVSAVARERRTVSVQTPGGAAELRYSDLDLSYVKAGQRVQARGILRGLAGGTARLQGVSLDVQR